MPIQNFPGTAVTPLGVPISQLQAYGGPARATEFVLVKAQRLVAYNAGRTTMITWDSLRAYIDEQIEAAAINRVQREGVRV
jgi:hypothetical protein